VIPKDETKQRRKLGVPSGLALTLAAAVFVIVGGLALFFVPEQLLKNWLPASTPVERARLIGTAAQLTLFALGGVIAVVGVALSLSRHGQELLRAEREREDSERHERTLAHEKEREIARRQEVAETRRVEQERSFRERYVGAVGLVAQDMSPTSRTAGIGALASLADDWIGFGRRDEAQLCIEMICAHIRNEAPTDDVNIERHVKHFATEQIRNRLVQAGDDTSTAWAGFRIDLSGIYIDFPLSFDHISVDPAMVISFSRARIDEDGSLSITSADSLGQIDLSRVRAEGNARLVVGEIEHEAPIDLAGRASLSLDQITMSGGSTFLLYLRQNDESYSFIHTARFEDDAKAYMTIQLSGHASMRGLLSAANNAEINVQGGALDASTISFDAGTLEHLATAHVGLGRSPQATLRFDDFDGVPALWEISLVDHE